MFFPTTKTNPKINMSLKAELLEISKQAEKEITEKTEKALFDSITTGMLVAAKKGLQGCILDFSLEFNQCGFLHYQIEIQNAKSPSSMRFYSEVDEIEKMLMHEKVLRFFITRIFRVNDELYGITTRVKGDKLSLDWGTVEY